LVLKIYILHDIFIILNYMMFTPLNLLISCFNILIMKIESEIVNWYFNNKRELPWRNTKNPYEIWVSEIILQQTRVFQALDYYHKFLSEFPDIHSLANADQQSILKVWQGLGYYSRARNMQQSAIRIVNELNGKFPVTYSEIIKLKGIGDYTAAAIASFAFNERVPAVDGNVYRVLSRLFDEKTPIDSVKGKKIFKAIACELIKTQEPYIFNQAMMEFGALQCLPKNPDCQECCLKTVCLAYGHNNVKTLPVKSKLSAKKERYFNYFFILNKDFTLIKKRTNKDIWHGLFEFPLIETPLKTDIADILKSNEWKILFDGRVGSIKSEPLRIKHLLTHQKINAAFYSLNVEEVDILKIKNSDFIKIKIKDLIKYPVPKIIENFTETL